VDEKKEILAGIGGKTCSNHAPAAEDGIWSNAEVPKGKLSLGSETKEIRVLRGGSFFSFHMGVRCAYRRRNNPDYRIDGSGFRVAVFPT
jgi:formylglycine-generating enzyme required for sulfatase activity